jgi:hypothetical protein
MRFQQCDGWLIRLMHLLAIAAAAMKYRSMLAILWMVAAG